MSNIDHATRDTVWEKHYSPWFAPLLSATAPAPDHAACVAQTKRLVECFVADSAFRKALAESPKEAALSRGLTADPEELRHLWDNKFAMEHSAKAAPVSVQRYRSFIHEKLAHRERLRGKECAAAQMPLRQWRERQINRCWTQLGEARTRAIVHAPFAVELSKGCSVGCWFCGVSSEKKKEDFRYEGGNISFWQDSLKALGQIFGSAAQHGFCYWATDPLDNPDYERFCLDFAHILGRFPQTTTAQAQKHIPRVRELLKISREHGCAINRFSVLSIGAFRKLMEAFTPEELLFTELVTQNFEANMMLSNSGRARGSEKLEQKAAALNLAHSEEEPGTIACVSGFLINMIDQRVKLVTPCPSSDGWPSGYWVFEEAGFASGEELGVLCQAMIDRHMPTSLRHNDPMAFRPDFAFASTPDGFSLTSYYTKSTFSGLEGESELGRLIAANRYGAGEIALSLEQTHGIAPEQTFMELNNLFQQGHLHEDPIFFAQKREVR
jgi:radical SAM family RiPP maturation amino acid epimerase